MIISIFPTSESNNCVSGKATIKMGGPHNYVSFGKTFERVPTFIVSVTGIKGAVLEGKQYWGIETLSVSKTEADIVDFYGVGENPSEVYVSWMACP